MGGVPRRLASSLRYSRSSSRRPARRIVSLARGERACPGGVSCATAPGVATSAAAASRPVRCLVFTLIVRLPYREPAPAAVTVAASGHFFRMEAEVFANVLATVASSAGQAAPVFW